jgi:dephospho-CoA kinase
MPDYAEPLARLIDELKRLPSIGQKSAQRIAFHLERVSREEAERRIQSQMPIDEKRRLADDVIDCSGSIEDTEKDVERLIARFKHILAKPKN